MTTGFVSALAALTLLVTGAAVSSSAAAAADAATAALSAEDHRCLACHGREGLSKRFGQGAERSLQVDGKAFAASAHAPLGCAGCHGEVDAEKHPGDDRAAAARFASWSEFERAQARGCRNCHQPIADAWATSAHGRTGGVGPNCATCHPAHAVRAGASASLRAVCLDCHQDAVSAHEAWLPNTKIHFEAVSCAACHAPGSGKSLELRLFDPVARKPISTPASPAALAQAASGETPIDAKRLARLMRGLDEQALGRVTLHGRIQVRGPAESHRLHEKGKALKHCVACHSKGADTFREVELTLIDVDGRQVRFEAQSDVLRSARSLDSLPGFYAIGGTRIGLMDTLLGLALLAGTGAPVLHLVLRRALRGRTQAAGATPRRVDSAETGSATPSDKEAA